MNQTCSPSRRPWGERTPVRLVAATFMAGVMLWTAASSRAERIVTLSSVCLLDSARGRTLDHAILAARRACAAPGSDLVVLPHMPFVTVRRERLDQDLRPFREMAAQHSTYLALACTETDGDAVHATSVLVDRAGNIACTWRKTHKFPEEDVALGNELNTFKTDFGVIAATIGSDFYFPEVYEVLRMKGAEILLWHHFPERFRDHSGWEPLLLARAFDSHAHFMAAHYSDPRPYIANRYSYGMQGTAFGRSMILNRVGVPVADTGYEDGVATAVVDLDKRKEDPYKGWKKSENCFYVNVLADRKAFQPVAEPWRPPQLPAFEKRSARVAVIAMNPENMWSDGRLPERLFQLLDQAAQLQPDIILASEMGANMANETTRRGLEIIAAKARDMRCYICIGGLSGTEQRSVARLWDRQGKMVWEQPIYWTKGFDEITWFDTDFARISTHTCGDLFAPFFDRTLALAGVDLILDPSQMWGPSGRVNESLLRARALDNAVWIACSHWNSSDPGLRSVIVDPYGQVMTSSAFQSEGIICYDIDFAQRRVYYEGRKAQQPKRQKWDIPSYFSEDLPQQKPGWREMIFSCRRPELYDLIPTTNDVIMKYRPEHWPD